MLSTERRIQRQEKILFSLEKLKFATRKQLQQLHQLGSDRNATKVLNAMREYLHVQNHQGMNVYYLNKTGREVIGTENEIKWTLQAEHHLLRNDLYLYYGMPYDWEVEQSIDFKIQAKDGGGTKIKQLTITPDAMFQKDGVFHLIEIDRTQSMSENKKKIGKYGLLSPIMAKKFGHHPVIVFYTVTESRRSRLEELCASASVKCNVLTTEDLR
jgi:hypothetical protein